LNGYGIEEDMAGELPIVEAYLVGLGLNDGSGVIVFLFCLGRVHNGRLSSKEIG